MDFITIIISLGITQGVLVGILLLTLKRGNIKANRLLGLLMIFFSISISGFLIERIEQHNQWFLIIEFLPTVIFLFGPLFYFYVLALVKKEFRFGKISLLHFLPFILVILLNIYRCIAHPRSELLHKNIQLFGNVYRIILVIQIIHIFIYIYFIKKILKEHELKIKSTLSSIENINLKWLNLTVILFRTIFGLVGIFLILYYAGLNIDEYFNSIIPVLVSITILGLGYWGFRQPIIFPYETDNKKSKKYEWSTLSDEQADLYLNKLKLAMNQEKPYLESSLTLQRLADMTGISPHHVSQIINERMNQNFFDFINYYRIKEAKRLLVDPRGELLTILAIAEEVGFNSKSSFNTAFKKATGMTPTEYKKSLSYENLL